MLRLACLGVTNAFVMLRLLPMSDREKDVEVLAPCHQIGVLQRQLNGQRVRFHAGERAFLVSLLHGLPREVLRRMRSPAAGDIRLFQVLAIKGDMGKGAIAIAIAIAVYGARVGTVRRSR